MKHIIIAGIGTGIGKTLISSIVVEALEADYWKPVQAGNLEFTDTDVVKSLVSNKRSIYHPEGYRLTKPMSPHAAAKIDGVSIELNKLAIPHTDNNLVIEVAGGVMVPLNDMQLNIDLIEQWETPVILVSHNYLGSINHTILSIDALRSRGIYAAGIIFNGERNETTEEFILHYTGLKCLGKINAEAVVSKEIVKRYAEALKENLNSL
jgi:dethiobiotin synthetase